MIRQKNSPSSFGAVVGSWININIKNWMEIESELNVMGSRKIKK